MNGSFIDTAFELIDMRSFSNLWYWIGFAVAWSSASYWVVGVPIDLVRRAARGDRAAIRDVAALGGIHGRRLVHITDVSGVLLTAFTWFAVTALLVLGFVYWIEFAQALFLLFAPLSLVGWLNVRTARRLAILPAEAAPIVMMRHRRVVQALGIVTIFLSAMWGMWANLNASVLS